ncbi:hypothetical protein AVEN_166676-1 [Araneus ventricosus]|uniref:Uncharacterized protein n=1 Tax=Araneus ventricosus TaxID=182803 RepID=A0A4Y2HGG6_ARAVE|nr:hypothetical protein AVEN_166676-1 [Araneus ventricosus]
MPEVPKLQGLDSFLLDNSTLERKKISTEATISSKRFICPENRPERIVLRQSRRMHPDKEENGAKVTRVPTPSSAYCQFFCVDLQAATE